MTSNINLKETQYDQLILTPELVEKNDPETTKTQQIYIPKKNPIKTSRIQTEPVKSINEQPIYLLKWKNINYFSMHIMNHCPAKCQITEDETTLAKSHAVLIWGWNLPEIQLPSLRPDQLMILMVNESPIQTYRHNIHFSPQKYNNKLNMTVTYRFDSDQRIFSHLLEKFPKKTEIKKNYWRSKQRNLTAVIMVSNCRAKDRMKMVRTLQDAGLNVDVYGKCGNKSCGKNKECFEILKKYHFYLAFENSLHCQDYITEKFWRNAIENELVPIVYGARKKNFQRLNIPESAFIHMDDFSNMNHLKNLNEKIMNLVHLVLSLFSFHFVVKQTKGDDEKKVSKDECQKLGYNPQVLLCSSCESLDNFNLSALKKNCMWMKIGTLPPNRSFREKRRSFITLLRNCQCTIYSWNDAHT
ncbi:hypothetical protein SNEBB_006055 [Seison nebaliae]|nr:hypothetical protein SNEBB_006055 [Seison nebaliae]